MKRKAEGPHQLYGASKKRALSDVEVLPNFCVGLFDNEVLERYTKEYRESKPYKHGVIHDLLSSELLRNVRSEVQQHLSFTPKETDIYKIHQSGDLANLDGLTDESLKLLPSLLTLRDSLYSAAFRKYISTVAGSGPLSGLKTDMAINVYTPGCHLLCHDDVIGSRRVSYILYLPNPDIPWKADWGGALRLYPTDVAKGDDGAEVRTPRPDFTVSIPPAFNQLSFFTVQPGESFHDVEEVYHRSGGDSDEDDGRVRMAISGWFHIPQEGEEGYEEGLEEKLAERSSLNQLQSKSNVLDLPQPQWKNFEELGGEEAGELTEEDLKFLIQYMNPNYLTPDVVEQLSGMFEEESSLRLSAFLSPKFSASLRSEIEKLDLETPDSDWQTARPPHKHRFLYRQALPEADARTDISPHHQLYETLLPSTAFRKWLALATGLTPTRANVLARRFRRGADYTLATAYEDEEPQLEVCLGITPTVGWGDDADADADAMEDSEDEIPAQAPPRKQGGSTSAKTKSAGGTGVTSAEDPVGGYEMYMAADEDEDDGGDDGLGTEEAAKASSHTGAGKRRKADPAVYRGGSGEDGEDDGVLFTMPAGWNSMSVVLRDKGVLKFVKYVSAAAKGDRWDVCAEFGVAPEDE